MPFTVMLWKMALDRLTKPFTIENLKSLTDSTVEKRYWWIIYFIGKRSLQSRFQSVLNASVRLSGSKTIRTYKKQKRHRLFCKPCKKKTNRERLRDSFVKRSIMPEQYITAKKGKNEDARDVKFDERFARPDKVSSWKIICHPSIIT